VRLATSSTLARGKLERRILVNFTLRDGWWIHCLAPDCKTLISRRGMVRTDAALLRLFQASGATAAQLAESGAT
jgi:hypothetical protein